MRAKEFITEGQEHFNGIDISMEIQKDDEYVDDEDYDNQVLYVTASSKGKELGHVLFAFDGEYLMPQDLEVEERYRGQGIAQTMYDYVKSKGYKIRRSGQQTDAGAGFWNKHKGSGQNVWEQGVAEDNLNELFEPTLNYYKLSNGKTVQVSYRPNVNQSPVPFTDVSVSYVNTALKPQGPSFDSTGVAKPWTSAPDGVKQAIQKFVTQPQQGVAEGSDSGTKILYTGKDKGGTVTISYEPDYIPGHSEKYIIRFDGKVKSEMPTLRSAVYGLTHYQFDTFRPNLQPNPKTALEQGVAEGFLNEGLAHPVIVVDVQPEYSGMNDGNESSVFPQIINFVNKQTGPVLMFVNAEDQGLSGDTIQDIKQYWDDTICPEEERYIHDEETDDYIENSNCPRINWQRFSIADKGYGYFRSWMDHGIEPATIIATIRELYQQKKSDSRELQFPASSRRTPQQSLIMGAMQEMEDDPISVNWTSVAQLKRFSGAYIVGGARDQCLREVELLMNAFNIKYKRIDTLIYTEDQQGVAEGKINPAGLNHTQQIGDYVYRAKALNGSDEGEIEMTAYDGKKSIADTVFMPYGSGGRMISGQTYVHPAYRGKGVAAGMYAYLRMLGFKIEPSGIRTGAGKAMWDKWEKAGDAKHLSKGVAEGVNPDVTSDEYFIEPTKNVRMGNFVFNARTFTGGLGNRNAKGLQIRAYDPNNLKNSIGSADFIVKKDKKGNTWLESDDTEVNQQYHGKGVATMMYAFAKSLGNDIKRSPYQSKAGSDMWNKWGKDAKNLVSKRGVAEGASNNIPTIGINVRTDGDIDYASLIVDGEKKYESRKTDSLRPYVGKTVGIVRTGSGPAVAIGQVTIGEPILVDAEKFNRLRKQHLVPQGSKFDIDSTGTKYLYPIIDPVRWNNEKPIKHKGIVSRKIQEQGVAEGKNYESS